MDSMKAVLDKALGEDASHDFDKIDQTGWGWLFFFCFFLFVCSFCLFVLFVWSHWSDRVRLISLFCFCFCRDYNAVCSHWSDRVRLIHPFFAFVEAAILAGHLIMTRCADPDRESAINIDVDRLFSCYHHDHQHHDHNDRHHHDQYHYHIIRNNMEQATRPQGGGGGRLWRRLRRLWPWCWAPVKFW